MNEFPFLRARRLRASKTLRRLVQETRLHPSDFIYPLFVVEGRGVEKEIAALPGQFHFSADRLVRFVEKIVKEHIPAVLLFGIPNKKDEKGSQAYAKNGVVQKAVRELKKHFKDLVVITDVCLCEYTSHGHCGVVKKTNRGGFEVLNDPSLALLSRAAVSHAEAGADMVAPSDMMDGRVRAVRYALDESGFENTPILSYAAKFASAFYGPFRDAAGSAPAFGDRRSYQMDPPNIREALKEVTLDVQESADIVMVKPALAYLDVIRAVKEKFLLPVAAYNVSGEYAMVKAAARKGWLDEKGTVLEILTSIKRSGASMILTYHALDAVKWLKSDEGEV